MTYTNESDFENYLRTIIKNNIINSNDELILLDNKNLADILICRNGDNPKLFFIEVKLEQESNGRLGFGGKEGSGFQPEILTKRPDYLESNLCWVLFSNDYNEDSNIIMIDSSTLISKYLSGGTVGRKYNGIKKSIFNDEASFSELEFIQKLTVWLKS